MPLQEWGYAFDSENADSILAIMGQHKCFDIEHESIIKSFKFFSISLKPIKDIFELLEKNKQFDSKNIELIFGILDIALDIAKDRDGMDGREQINSSIINTSIIFIKDLFCQPHYSALHNEIQQNSEYAEYALDILKSMLILLTEAILDEVNLDVVIRQPEYARKVADSLMQLKATESLSVENVNKIFRQLELILPDVDCKSAEKNENVLYGLKTLMANNSEKLESDLLSAQIEDDVAQGKQEEDETLSKSKEKSSVSESVAEQKHAAYLLRLIGSFKKQIIGKPNIPNQEENNDNKDGLEMKQFN